MRMECLTVGLLLFSPSGSYFCDRAAYGCTRVGGLQFKYLSKCVIFSDTNLMQKCVDSVVIPDGSNSFLPI